MRIGHGYDVHRFCEGDYVVIGGVKIQYEKKLLAQSDGDVLAHAIADSLLGAAGQRDIGFFFPDNDQKYRNIDSMILLSKVKEICFIQLHSSDIVRHPLVQKIIEAYGEVQ